MTILQYILAILGFSVIILVHELGHFTFARLSKMYVSEFFIGFGPKILKFKSRRSGTQYGLSAIPLGGYNKILGTDRQEKIPEGLEDKAFYNKPFYKKFLVISGGGIFNIIFAFVLIIIYFSMGVFMPTNTIDYIQPDSPADLYGFLQGDKVLALDNNQISGWEDFTAIIQNYPDKTVVFTVERDSEIIQINTVLSSREGSGYLGVGPLFEKVRLGFFRTISESFKMIWDLTATYARLFVMLISGQLPIEYARPASPIGVISIFQQSAAMGFQNFLLFVAIISVLVAFGNFIPILPVDGGHIVIIIIEAIRKRPVPKKVIEVYTTIGIIFVVSLLFIGLIFDIISPFNLQNM